MVTSTKSGSPAGKAAPQASDDELVGVWMRKHQNVGVRLLGLPVSGLEKIGAAVIKWDEGPPESDTDWMHTTRFPSDKIRQECIDGFWEERERKARGG